jgi:hypothetical protein
MVRTSYDGVDLCAARMMPVWHPLLPADSAPERAAALRDWAVAQTPWPDADARVQLGLFHALHHELLRALLEPQLGAARTRALLVDLAAGLTFQHNLDAVLSLQRPDLLDAAALTQLLARAWPAALDAADSGRFWVPVRAPFVHFIGGERLPPMLGFGSTPRELPGGPVSPFQSRVVAFEGQKMVIGPAFHLLFDMSGPGGWYNIPGGASERRFGPGYGEGIDGWLAGRFRPLGSPPGEAPDL